LIDYWPVSDSLVERFPGGDLERVLTLLRDHNMVLLSLILHLMVSGDGEEQKRIVNETG
jgi:hypothetical protein